MGILLNPNGIGLCFWIRGSKFDPHSCWSSNMQHNRCEVFDRYGFIRLDKRCTQLKHPSQANPRQPLTLIYTQSECEVIGG